MIKFQTTDMTMPLIAGAALVSLIALSVALCADARATRALDKAVRAVDDAQLARACAEFEAFVMFQAQQGKSHV